MKSRRPNQDLNKDDKDKINRIVVKFRDLFRANKTICLSENDPNVKEMFKSYCRNDNGNAGDKAINQLKDMFIDQINKKSQTSEIIIREKEKKVR